MSETKPSAALVVVSPRYEKVPDAWPLPRLLGQALEDVEDDTLWRPTPGYVSPIHARPTYRNTLRDHIQFCRTNGRQSERSRSGMWNIIRVNNDIRAQREKAAQEQTQARQLANAEAMLAEGKAFQRAKAEEKDAAKKAAAQARRVAASAVAIPPPPLPSAPAPVVRDTELNAKQIYTRWGLSSITTKLRTLPSFPKPISESGAPRWWLSEITAFEASDSGRAAIAKTVARGQRYKHSREA